MRVSGLRVQVSGLIKALSGLVGELYNSCLCSSSAPLTNKSPTPRIKVMNLCKIVPLHHVLNP